MRKFKIGLNLVPKKYILFSNGNGELNAKVCIYRKYWIFCIRKYCFPVAELSKAVEYMNHLENR